MPKYENFDITKIFNDTKVNLENSIEQSKGRISMLEELTDFFAKNNLKVVRELPDEEVVNEVVSGQETAKKSK